MKPLHPAYIEMLTHWSKCLKCYQGEWAIKDATIDFLPYTAGMLINDAGTTGSIGSQSYENYISRAVFPDTFKESIETAIGAMHRAAPTVVLPEQLKYLEDSCSPLGESIQQLLRRINVAQLLTGRIGLAGDIKPFRLEPNKMRIVLTTYSETSAINWNDVADPEITNNLSLVVLEESGKEMQPDMTYKDVSRFKILALGDPETGELDPNGSYMVGEILGEDVNLEAVEEWVKIENLGNSLNEIPFSFINSKDTSPTPDFPPQLGLADLCLVIYKGEADYRQHLFMQGQDTLVRIGHVEESDIPAPISTGAGAVIDVPVSGNAKFIGVQGTGLTEQRESLENDYQRAEEKGGKLLSSSGRTAESGEALRLRIGAQTVTLPQLAAAAAKAVENVIKAMCPLVGANPDEVSIEPNLDFTDDILDAASLVAIMTAKDNGAPISFESIHAWLTNQNATTKTFDEEMEAIELEESFIVGLLRKHMETSDAAKRLGKPAIAPDDDIDGDD